MSYPGLKLPSWRVVVLGGAFALVGCSSLPEIGESGHVQDRVADRTQAILSDGQAGRISAPVEIAGTVAGTSNFVPPFSQASSGDALPPGWESWVIHPRKKPTRYRVVVEGGRPILRAQASASASGLLAKVNVDLAKTPYIEWTWRTDGVLENADNLVASLEDSPARLVLAFEGDRASLPLKDQLFFERVKLFTGADMPYATLMYIWGNRKPVESVLANPHSQRVQKIVVNNRASGVKRWHRQRRNIVDDYRRAFGRAPGRLVGVAVMTDSDNTQGEVVAYYGDIRLLGKIEDDPITRRASGELAAER